MDFNLLDPNVSAYLHALVPERSEELQAMEAYADEHSFPIIGPVVGHLCYLLARSIGARQVFELGSGYGYSTAWFARAVQEAGGGKVFHTVWDEELSRRAREHLGKLGYDDVIEYRVGESIQALRDTPGTFDLIFNDINKEAYPESLTVIAERIRPGGMLIIDNMFLGGRIFDQDNQSDSVEGVRELTRQVTTSEDWAISIIPIRDGVLLAYRR